MVFLKRKLIEYTIYHSFNSIFGPITDLHCPQGEPGLDDDMEVARAGQELNQEVNRLMVAMRDMLANIRFQEPPRDDNPYRDDEEWD